MSNILIVESHNDQVFIEALIQYINLPGKIETMVESICQVDDYECLKGLSEKALTRTLNTIRNNIVKKNIEKVGIILDMDTENQESRPKLINGSIEHSEFEKMETALLNIAKFTLLRVDDSYTVQFACYFIQIDGKGELETLLKAIKKKSSPYADCLEKWRACLKNNDKKIKDKDFDKFWINTYHRYDCCTKEEQKQSGKNCIFQNVIKEKGKQLYDFNSSYLDELKKFLNSLC